MKYIFLVDWNGGNGEKIYKVDISDWDSVTLEDTWTCPNASILGGYHSLDGDGISYLYWAGGADDKLSFSLYKIQISNMTTSTVQSYAVNGRDFLSLKVIGDYIYVAVGYNAGAQSITPRILKINKSTLALVSTLVLGGSPDYYPELHADCDDSNILWVGSWQSSYDPIIHKIDLSTFTEVATQEYNIVGCDGGSPALAQDSTYLYVFFKYGDRMRVLKSNLATYDLFTNADLDQYPRRWFHVVDGRIYIIFDGDRLVRFDASDLTEDFDRNNWNVGCPNSWVIGLIHFDDEADIFYAIDMDTTCCIKKLRDTGAAFSTIGSNFNLGTGSDIYACWKYSLDLGDCYLSNSGGTLAKVCIIEFSGRQACKVAVRSVPLRTAGSFVDTGTWTLKNRRLSMTIRLTDAEKTMLQAIFDATAMVTIVMKTTTADYPRWNYTAWLVKKPLTYEYSKDSDGNVNEWIAELEFVCSTFSYAESA